MGVHVQLEREEKWAGAEALSSSDPGGRERKGSWQRSLGGVARIAGRNREYGVSEPTRGCCKKGVASCWQRRPDPYPLHLGCREARARAVPAEGVGAGVGWTGCSSHFSRVGLLGSHPGSAGCWLHTPGHRLTPFMFQFCLWNGGNAYLPHRQLGRRDELIHTKCLDCLAPCTHQR